MRVCLKECKDAELVRSSVPIARKNDIYENTQPEIENCSDGIAPQPNTVVDGSQKMIEPVVVSMTKYLFAHYRLQMYAYLNNSLRSGMLERIVGFSFTNRTINREVCTFKGVNYWRMDRLNFWADVSVTLLLSTAKGKREWCGYLCFWFSAEQPGPLTGTIEELTSVKDGPERSGMTLLSPFLIPYFTAAKIDMEAENIWAACIPGALDHPELRKAEMLAGAMGLSMTFLFTDQQHFIGIQQAVKRHAHGLVGGHVGDIPILIVEAHHEQNRQPHRFRRGIGKLRSAVILRRGLRLRDQAGQIGVLFVILDAEMGFDLIHGNDHRHRLTCR